MKKLIILVLFFINTNTNTNAQRYVTYVFTDLDSIIGGTYGNAIDYLGSNQNLLFDFYAPKSDTILKRPLIIYIHGGGFTSGTRAYPSVKLLCKKMARKGYAVATIDYRLDPNFQLYNSEANRRAMTDAMHDAKEAIRYFKANAELYKIDTTKVFIGGESAGSITAMMAAYVDKQEETSPYPLANPNNPVGSNSNSHVGNTVQATMCLCGMLLDTTAIEDSNDPPILWTHGSNDSYIPISLSFNVVKRALNVGLPIQTKVYKNATHCPWYYGNPNWETYLDSTINEITSFLYPKVATTVNMNAAQDSKINLYPNPCIDYLNVDVNKHYPKINISIVSSAGKVYRTWRFHHTKEMRLDLKGLANGLYVVRIEFENNVLAKKIMINRKITSPRN